MALKRQSEKQLELIRKLEDHEKNLTNLVVNILLLSLV